ncbi:ATP-binding cassette domain-containing protein [Candidatus Mycosynbacter amalyticus]|uniref:ATP-binding cassette domain-containing protein n=1 Tax=Candidatus Mycosynbacter amalyticus TaxID=2665156 RepID=A0A857MTJ8_9BACT|nr:ABC transporter ATP-binding protein [Candidatus Mycosynbacter amalyticus]QHN42747.1 ATP-binding cassette domain-containing protein [Candidatus Mycosynbacter amalyticus]
MLVVEHLTRTFKSGGEEVHAVDDLKFSVDRGEFVSIIGKSGSGKSTLLSMLGALDKPTGGSIKVDEQDIAKMSDHSLIRYRCHKIGFVFQNYNLIPNLTALENVMLPMEFAGVAPAERKDKAAALLSQVGIEPDQMKRKPGKLSGGQQQRVSIARALANKPSVILADEPTGNLDEQTGKMVFDLLHSLAKTEKTTIIVVTHDLDIAGKTDRTFRLSDGKLKEVKK